MSQKILRDYYHDRVRKNIIYNINKTDMKKKLTFTKIIYIYMYKKIIQNQYLVYMRFINSLFKEVPLLLLANLY